MLPRLTTWQFTPNAFVRTQSAKQLIRPWPGWDARPGNVAYLRRRFTVR
jgi:hypothetical protein